MFGSLLASQGDAAGLHIALLIAMGLIPAVAALSSWI